MNRQTASCAVILSGLLFASPAFAGSDISKCVAPSGAVTLTDEACPANTRAVKLISAAPESDASDAPALQAGPRVPTVERFNSAPMPLRFAPPMRGPAPARGMSLDIATLKAAKANLHLSDLTAPRNQRLAGMP